MADDTEDRTPLRGDFVRTLTWVLDNQEVSHRELAKRLGWDNDSRISRWLESTAEPTPRQVFAIERAVRVPPGTLSRTLGYLPPEARTAAGAQVSLDEAIDAHPTLPPEAKKIIRCVIEVFTPAGAKRTRHRKLQTASED